MMANPNVFIVTPLTDISVRRMQARLAFWQRCLRACQERGAPVQQEAHYHVSHVHFIPHALAFMHRDFRVMQDPIQAHSCEKVHRTP